MSEGLGNNSRKETIKGIIKSLHQGISAESAAERVRKEIGAINAQELARIEQELIDEGVPISEIQLFCSVHALIFSDALTQGKAVNQPETNHAVQLFRSENRILAEFSDVLGSLFAAPGNADASVRKAQVEKLRPSFALLEIHYQKKEQILFPFLEKHGFPGPSKVMWGKHDEIRGLVKQFLDHHTKDNADKLIREVTGMIEKEEKILYPTALEKIDESEWETVRNSFLNFSGRTGIADEAGIAHEAGSADAVVDLSPTASSDYVRLPSGNMSAKELVTLFNTLPVDVSFVDASDCVKYFSEPKDRIFPRPRSVLGRNVENCHPPKSLDAVKRIVDAFKSGTKDHEDFWINMKGRFILIRYFALRDENGTYLGTLEVSQDLTELRALEGEKRLAE